MTAPASVSASVVVTSLALDTTAAPALILSGTFSGDAPETITLTGRRLQLSAPVSLDGDGWTARVELLAARWGGPALPPPSGAYHAGVSFGEQSVRATAGLAAPRRLPPESLVPGALHLRLAGATDGSLTAHISAPLGDSERGRPQQARLEAAYVAARPEPLDAVFFESFYGQNVSDNPLAIDRALALARPDVARYWSVSDASVAVPPGAIAIIDGSEEWWRVRAAARVLVVNDWLRRRYVRRPHQVVLQTWHGTPLKRIALSRRGVRLRAAVATVRESHRWTILLSQNAYSSRIFRSAYAFFKGTWEDGYPRNDVLAPGAASPDDVFALRARLGIAADARVLLYAPTWRDDRPEHVDHLDVARFTRELGDGYVTLVRGHSRTLTPGSAISGANVIDVTGYPSVSELFLVADALVTDYSSVMFDFTVTGKPIYFFVPDLELYRTQLRGFYFDLLGSAPGPVVQTADELVRVVADDAVPTRPGVPAQHPPRYADRYAAWRAKFNPRDDGHAAERVVARLLATGALD